MEDMASRQQLAMRLQAAVFAVYSTIAEDPHFSVCIVEFPDIEVLEHILTAFLTTGSTHLVSENLIHLL